MVNKTGFSPMHRSASFGDIGMISYLLSKGANINRETNDGFTPYYYAKINKRGDEVTKYLLENGAHKITKNQMMYYIDLFMSVFQSMVITEDS